MAGVEQRAAGRFPRAFATLPGRQCRGNLQIADRLKAIADAKGITAAQLAIAWVAAQGQDIVPLVGAKTRTRLQEALGALDVTLSAEDLAAIEAAVPRDAIRGDRYPAMAMASLDSERS